VTQAAEPELTLMALWSRHKRECRSISEIVSDARAGKLAGVEPLESGFGHRVTDEQAALAAMQRKG
jgi:hypothetical protein